MKQTTITASDLCTEILRMEQENRELRERLAELSGSSVDARRFYAVALTAGEVARLHGVSPARVRDYAKAGLIERHPDSTDAKMLFRASSALALDFRAMRREKRQSVLMQQI